MASFQLPGRGWEGWRFHSGKLWTPEGHAIEPTDGAWWSQLVRQARGFRAAYAELTQLRHELRRAWQAGYLVPPWESAEIQAGHAERGRPESGGVGLVPSINNAETLGETQPDGVSFGYQFDHVKISCPTLCASPPILRNEPGSGPSPSGSASTPSSASASMPTLAADSLGRSRRGRGLSPSQPNRQSLQGLPLVNLIGGSSMTPKCGPTLIQSSKTDGGKSVATTATKQRPQRLKLSTGPRASVRKAVEPQGVA